MKIAIIGAGAMGCLFGAKLSAVQENEVFLLGLRKELVDEINKNGVQVETDGVVCTYKNLKAETDAGKVGISDLVIVFVKSYSTREAVEDKLALFGKKTVALTLQNGVGNIEIISDIVGAENVIAGTTAHGATTLGFGKVRHAGKGKTAFGELDGQSTERIKTVQAVLEKAEIENLISNNVFGIVWDKLLVNAGINALAGITRLPNGKILDHPGLINIMSNAVTEGMNVANAKGIKLIHDNPVKNAKDVCAATAKNQASMLQDILNGKQTEIDMINGAIVREGAMLGVKTPVNEVLTNLIKSIRI